MRIFFDDELLGDLDAADLGDAADVVAREVDQHHVFGDFLGVGQQFGGELGVQFRRGAARTGAGQRADRDFALAVAAGFIAHQDFRRGTDDLHVAEIVVIHVGRRIQRAQRAVQRQRRIDVGLPDALADLYLHQVAGHHVFLGARHRLQVILLGEFAHAVGAHRSRGHRRIDRAPQHGAQVLQPLARFGEGFRLARVGVHDQVQLAGQVVDHRQFFGHQQLDLGQAEVVRRRRIRQPRLDVAHRVVAEIAGQAAAEARHAGTDGDLVARLESGDEFKRITFGALHHFIVFQHFDAVAEAAQQGRGRQADEGIAAEALAADHRFQQEGILAGALGLGQLQIQGQRCFQVGEGFGDQRNAVVALRGQRLEFEFGHGSLRAARSRCAAGAAKNEVSRRGAKSAKNG